MGRDRKRMSEEGGSDSSGECTGWAVMSIACVERWRSADEG